jgi:hypothetical protein
MHKLEQVHGGLGSNSAYERGASRLVGQVDDMRQKQLDLDAMESAGKSIVAVEWRTSDVACVHCTGPAPAALGGSSLAYAVAQAQVHTLVNYVLKMRGQRHCSCVCGPEIVVQRYVLGWGVRRCRRGCQSVCGFCLAMLPHRIEASRHAGIRHMNLVSAMVYVAACGLHALCRGTCMSVTPADRKHHTTYL